MEAYSRDERELLRHFLATLAYRGARCLEGAPEAYTRYDTGGGRTPLVILAHMGDLLEWALSMAEGEGRWQPETPEDWQRQVLRFHQGLERLDHLFASDRPLQAEGIRLLQGPLADAMTHVGQLAILRRMAGAPAPRENFYLADIQKGQVGPTQAPPRRPF